MKLSTFKTLWNQLVPYIVRTKPMTGLCWECQKNNLALYCTANMPDSLKSEKVQKQNSICILYNRKEICTTTWCTSLNWLQQQTTFPLLQKMMPVLITFQCIIAFIHSGHYNSAPSSPLLLRGAPDYSTDTVSEFHAEAHRQLQVKDLPKVPTWRLERESNPRPSG